MRHNMLKIGLLSDTHMPRRWKRLPKILHDIFEGVDLIFHAGDIGELWVLDELAEIAPVIAVHGNDETDEATAALPYLQTIGLTGRRILLTHSHYPDHDEEIASRQIDDWEPKFKRLANMGRQHGAEIVVFGHTHIPMVVYRDDVWLVNPGAIASGGYFVRQAVQTAAVMMLNGQRGPFVEHFDLAEGEVHLLLHDWSLGFADSAGHYTKPIIVPEIMQQIPWLREHIVPMMTPQALDEIILPVAFECWEGRHDLITVPEFVEALRAYDETPAEVIEKMRESPVFAPFL